MKSQVASDQACMVFRRVSLSETECNPSSFVAPLSDFVYAMRSRSRQVNAVRRCVYTFSTCNLTDLFNTCFQAMIHYLFRDRGNPRFRNALLRRKIEIFEIVAETGNFQLADGPPLFLLKIPSRASGLDGCRPPRPQTRNRPLPTGCMSTSLAESCERRPRHGAIAASAQLH